MAEVVRASHFDSMGRQAEAGRVFMWVFLASEALLFTALFGLYAGYRGLYPEAFAAGIHHTMKIAGSLNTMILLISSYFVASAVLFLEKGHRRRALVCTVTTVVLGAIFLALKVYEYRDHLIHGLYPGGAEELEVHGVSVFFALYYFLTGAHAIHVMVGMSVLSWLSVRLYRGDLAQGTAHPLELGALYWHLVDTIWIFLWPLFYLTSTTGGGG
jgi:cytochrome c oxidase subunit 3